MSKNRVIVEAVLAGQSHGAVARQYGISTVWVGKLVGRWRVGGWDAVEKQSTRPKSNPRAATTATIDAVLALRAQLIADGFTTTSTACSVMSPRTASIFTSPQTANSSRLEREGERAVLDCVEEGGDVVELQDRVRPSRAGRVDQHDWGGVGAKVERDSLACPVAADDCDPRMPGGRLAPRLSCFACSGRRLQGDECARVEPALPQPRSALQVLPPGRR